MVNYKIKNKETTLLMCIFGGWFGLHHFYNKQIGKGLLYFFTGGLLYIGWIMDIIKIVKIKEENNTNNNNINIYINYPKSTRERTADTLYKKNKINKFVNDYIVFDLETTGLDSNDDEIIEIGALKYRNNELIDKYNVLINPKMLLPKKIIKLTGITDEMLQDERTINEVLPEFINWIGDYTLIAHNGSFDIGFIESKIKKYNLTMIQNKNIDTLYLARKYITETENHKLETLKKYFNLDFKSHRAIEDCYVTNYIYQYCKNK